MTKLLEGRIALVTGGGRGIGRGISELLAAQGAAVAISYRRDADAAAETEAAIRAAGGIALAVPGSVDDADQCAAMVETVVDRLGPIDLLVHNGGIASRGNSVADTAVDEVERLLWVHAIGPHQLTRLVLPSMRTRPRGDIVFISSVATSHHAPYGAPYNMGKAAMEALAFTLAKEERDHGIHVNVVAPGLVVSEMGRRLARASGVADIHDLDASSPFGHVGTPDDVARVVLFCCSDLSGYVTGQRIEVDGGGSTFRSSSRSDRP